MIMKIVIILKNQIEIALRILLFGDAQASRRSRVQYNKAWKDEKYDLVTSIKSITNESNESKSIFKKSQI